jgi:hypothetical protein
MDDDLEHGDAHTRVRQHEDLARCVSVPCGLFFAAFGHPIPGADMSERHKTHNGRDQSGHFKVKQADIEEKRNDPQGDEYVRDDVRLGGAIEDTGARAGEAGKRIAKLVEDNGDDVYQAAETD